MVKRCALAELIFVKLGGSLITDKKGEAAARPEVIARLAEEVREALDSQPGLQLLLGHGSGSFGHVVAQRYRVQSGCTDWRGYALTSAAAARLNRIVTDGLLQAGVPVVSVQPSASARASAGQLRRFEISTIDELLARGLVPLVYGDVALDDAWGTTIISTEIIFAYLARMLNPQRIVLAGEVAGVYSADPRSSPAARLIPVISARRLDDAGSELGGSHGVDVTGGMHSKVHLMVDLVRDLPGLRIHLLSGLQPGLLRRVLVDTEFNPGTLIMW
ncbi:MAG: isopentenyl phosphate kinase family protein [Chloroflexi bacterium]|nr:isopentenyl phosphate kinase family protein [Chloroflexota bacterium]